MHSGSRHRGIDQRIFSSCATLGPAVDPESNVEILTAESLCRSLIAEHLGERWQFEWDRAVRRFGMCRWDERVISLSRALTEINDEDAVRDTVLHEIAHGLAPRRAGHGEEWRRIAVALGARPDRVLDPNAIRLPPPSYLGRCPSCGWETRAHRRRTVACRRCCVRFHRGKFSTRFQLVWERFDGSVRAA
jgi:predicted SprT family Zn-dependent metalloprotease